MARSKFNQPVIPNFDVPIRKVPIVPVPYKAKECSWCGAEFRSSGNYCSEACRKRLRRAATQA